MKTDNLTILIPTSPIPSHPSCAILDETISNIRKYTQAKIIILFDGVHSSLTLRMADYRKYMESVHKKLSEYGDCSAIVFNEHTHQAEMTRVVLDTEVKTPLIMFNEHDCSPIGDIPFQQICDLVETSKEINYVRFSIYDKIPHEHNYLMLYKQSGVFDRIPLTRTVQFSARPHIAKADWYRDILNKYFEPEEKTMIEDRMHSVVQVKYDEFRKDMFGLAIYTPPGNQLRSYHSDGRGGDTKIIEG